MLVKVYLLCRDKRIKLELIPSILLRVQSSLFQERNTGIVGSLASRILLCFPIELVLLIAE